MYPLLFPKGMTQMSYLYRKKEDKLKHLSFAPKEPFSPLRRHADKPVFFLFLAAFYLFLLLFIRPVDGINDDWGMYSTLSGAYTGTPNAHVLFFLYPLSWLLCRLYQLNSSMRFIYAASGSFMPDVFISGKKSIPIPNRYCSLPFPFWPSSFSLWT